jgi:hypothetical protein
MLSLGDREGGLEARAFRLPHSPAKRNAGKMLSDKEEQRLLDGETAFDMVTGQFLASPASTFQSEARRAIGVVGSLRNLKAHSLQ